MGMEFDEETEAVFTLDDLIEDLKKPARIDVDRIVIITGTERKGKSTLSQKLAREINANFTAEQIAFDNTELRAKGVTTEKGTALILDEPIDGAFNRDAMNKANKQLVKFLIVCGERNLVLFILCPNIHWLDPYIREHRSHYWIHVPKRGQAILHLPMRSRFAKQTYWKGVLEFPFGKLDDPEFLRYLQRKNDKVSNVGARMGEGDAFTPEVVVNLQVDRLTRLIQKVLKLP